MSEIKVMNNDEIRDFCIKKDLKIFELEQELQQKENIIKEVRGYIESYMPNYDFDKTNLIKLLEILNKGSDSNE